MSVSLAQWLLFGAKLCLYLFALCMNKAWYLFLDIFRNPKKCNVMADDWKKYASDPRSICKYGSKCYQKNPEHHKTFKHPPNNFKVKGAAAKNRRPSPYSRDKKPIVLHNKNEEFKHDEASSSNQSESVQVNALDSDTGESVLTNNVINLPDKLSYFNATEVEKLKELFLFEMPQDFFDFYECLNNEAKSVNTVLSEVNLELIGPFDLLLGKLPKLDEKELYLIHWRFFYDPPEFQSILKKKGNSQYHIGYFRDQPNEKPPFLASNDCAKDCHITPIADNIFGAVYLYLQNEKNSSPFITVACQKLMEKVKKWAEEKKFSLEKYDTKKRWSETVTKTFHNAGIVVPYNKKTQLGYRPLVETNAKIKKLFEKLNDATSETEKDIVLSDIQPIITYANIAVDECDFGTGLEAGINLFCSGLKELEPSTLSCLTAAYSLLNRDAFSKIIQAHLKHRRKGANMSVLSLI